MLRIIKQSLSVYRSLQRSTRKSFKGDTLMLTKLASQVPENLMRIEIHLVIGDAHEPFSTMVSQAILIPQGDYVSCSNGEVQGFKQPIKEDGSLSFLVVGDWGRKGSYNQCRVAHQMGRIGEQLEIDFVISTGDNFYTDGLKVVGDPAFHEWFVNIYTASSLQKQWYNVLGNHDYRGDVEAQFSPLLWQLDSKWFCLRSYVVDADVYIQDDAGLNQFTPAKQGRNQSWWFEKKSSRDSENKRRIWNGDRYSGEYFGDKIYGFGKYHFSNGHCYERSWQEGGICSPLSLARNAAENAIHLPRVDEQVNKVVTAANRAATAASVAAIKAVQNRMDGKFCDTDEV
ncbi:hypothetical protein MKX01_035764 [Papaver californicum]|nr:hypothetical protein MKX01_035764 [Papaver californicum]